MLIVLGAACPPTVDAEKLARNSTPNRTIIINFFFMNLSPSKHSVAVFHSHLSELDGMSCRELVSQLSSPCRACQAASALGQAMQISANAAVSFHSRYKSRYI